MGCKKPTGIDIEARGGVPEEAPDKDGGTRQRDRADFASDGAFGEHGGDKESGVLIWGGVEGAGVVGFGGVFRICASNGGEELGLDVSGGGEV